MNDSSTHVPVMLAEVLQWLAPRRGQVLIDGTLGGGGHTRALAEAVGPDGYVIALDRDPAAIRRAEQSLKGMNVKLANANFSQLDEILNELRLSEVDGVLLDLGLSSDQLAESERGFSFDSAGELDMRFDPSEGEPAWRLLEKLDATKLADVIYRYGEERHSRRIARRIIEERDQRPIRTARDLAAIVRRSVPRASGRERIDPATRTFQALRIAVNDELGSLETALRKIPDRLKPLGRVAVISFHSLEDRIVKEAFRDDPRYRALLRKPLVPSDEETERNPRSRSAKMRVAERSVTA